MKEFTYEIKDALGIHVRPAGVLGKLIKDVNSVVTISCNGKSVDAKRMIALMGLGVKKGDLITVTIEGEDEDDVLPIVENFFKTNL